MLCYLCRMLKLNFPDYQFRFKSNENKPLIFDEIRKKFIVLTPEEWVRQHTLKYLISEKNYPKSLINVERELKLHNTLKRYDIVVFNRDGSIRILVECKAPGVVINQQTFDQIARYNFTLNADYLFLTNGLNHFACRMDFENEQYTFLKEVPTYE
ncbi:restriction endonuclease subunit R [Constantimarinum furrinae]|uniref:Restriction endonuclease subunit R n=2 Tax=Constantimarinum furrinae TaxID=2562285 RepID=A0A7G8PXU9_9FLAO|nr:restriction endonuclease subunit R [Constantimarinum furrinae]